jgi:sugar phosphate isomerase/epimerase
MPPETTRIASLNRRAWFRATAAAGLAGFAAALKAADPGKKTEFQVACMTLPYARFPLERALSGIQSAGYRYVAWGSMHTNGSERVPTLAGDAPPARAQELARRCRDLGLEPVLMFGPSPESVDALKQRILQAAAAGVAQVLTMGTTKGNDPALWVKNFKELAPIARDHGVRIVVKQHGGNTGTGKALAEITRQVDDEGVKISYDAGNVMDYLDIDPLPDLRACAGEVRGFCIKDHRNFPKDQDCGPGFGEIDHYRLLQPVAFGRGTMPLCCENIFAPLLPPPADPSGIDALARRAREYLEVVIQGLQT